MAKPNYSFAKRQRELAKKAKKEEKLKAKRELKEENAGPEASPQDETETPPTDS